MASNTEMTPLKEEVLEKEGPEIRADSPLLDLSDEPTAPAKASTKELAGRTRRHQEADPQRQEARLCHSRPDQ